MEIRKSRIGDLPVIQSIFAYAREKMKQTGNPNQWGEDRPYDSDILNDIYEGNSYVITESDSVLGTFSAIPGIDPTYTRIYNGIWLNDQPYFTIHRIAGADGSTGILKSTLDFVKNSTENVRIDTHEDNMIMQHLLEKYGFVRCGNIIINSGDSRIAYHFIGRELTYEEKRRKLFLAQIELLDTYLNHGTITMAQYEKSYGDLAAKMGFEIQSM